LKGIGVVAGLEEGISALDNVSIKYYFLLENGTKKSFAFQFEPFNPENPENNPKKMPDWTRLDFYQCPICPYEPGSRKYCSLAANLVDIIKRFDGLLSYEQVYLKVVTEEREVSRKTSVQHAMSSLMGLAIASSGCPHTSFFAPMAHFHMPLSSVRETVFRAVSSYLLSQYFLKQDGKPADFELNGLTEIYRNMQVVNIATANRLRAATESDSTVNAIILLDTFAQALPIMMDTALEEIKKMYAPYYASSIKPPAQKQEEKIRPVIIQVEEAVVKA
jgi:hypothetical protein